MFFAYVLIFIVTCRIPFHEMPGHHRGNKVGAQVGQAVALWQRHWAVLDRQLSSEGIGQWPNGQRVV